MSMAMLDEYLDAFANDYANQSPEAQDIWDIIKGASHADPSCYKWNDEAHRAFAVAATKDIAAMGADWTNADRPFQDGAPRPEPKLRAQPQY
jgi:hypothetical protein